MPISELPETNGSALQDDQDFDPAPPEKEAYPSSTDPLGIYLHQIGDIPLLSREKELALAMDILKKRTAFRESVLTSSYGARRALAILSEIQDGSRSLDRTLEIRPIDHRGKKVTREKQQDRLRKRLPMNLQTLNALLDTAPSHRKRHMMKIYTLLEETPIATDLLRAIPQERHIRMNMSARALVEQEQELATNNLRLVVAIARKYRNRGLAFSDLIQEGNKGLLRAVQMFEPRLGWKFGTYATWWIRQAITRALEDFRGAVRVPNHASSSHYQTSLAEQEYIATYGEEPPLSLLEKISGKSRETLAAVMLALRPSVSMDTPIGGGEGEESATVSDLIPAPNGHIVEIAGHHELRERLEEVLRTLPGGPRGRHAQIIRLRFFEEKTLDEVAEVLNGVTCERIRQLQLQALQKLRSPERRERLEGFLEKETV